MRELCWTDRLHYGGCREETALKTSSFTEYKFPRLTSIIERRALCER